MKALTKLYCFFAVVLVFGPKAAMAQSITVATDGTGTTVTNSSNSSQFDVDGGTQAGANLFHSFEQLGLGPGQIVNFLSNPDIDNILGRVVGGDASFIDGLVQITGGQSNLFLMNPAGVVFGPNSQLNIPSDLTATTANGIQIDGYWFNALGSNDYTKLVGTPHSFAFTVESPGTILNAGELAVTPAQRIRLIGGTVVNTGTLSTPGGYVVIEAVPKAGVVNVTPEGSLLSLELPIEIQTAVNNGTEPLTALALPQLLSNNSMAHATGLVVEDSGIVRLTNSDISIPTDVGVAIASGTLNTANPDGTGGNIDVLGERVGLVGATLEASGLSGGGSVRIGGDYQGSGPISNAEQTYIDQGSTIKTDALNIGNGGQVIVWSDGTTAFHGEISAQGGTVSGDGGFVEVSGHQHLAFDGNVDVSAVNGNVGTLLLDPQNILISNASSSERVDANLPDILENNFNGEGTTLINAEVLQQQTGNIRLEATNDIRIADGISLTFVPGSSINFAADVDGDEMGSFSMDADESIVAPGRDLEITAASITAGTFDTSGETDQDGGNVSLTSTIGDIIISSINASGGFADDSNDRNGTSGGDITIDAAVLFRAIGLSVNNGNFTGPVSLVTIGNLPDDGDREDELGLVGGRISIKHGSEKFVIGTRLRDNDQVNDDESQDLDFFAVENFSFGEEESGTVGAIVSRNDNGQNRVVYEDDKQLASSQVDGEVIDVDNSNLEKRREREEQERREQERREQERREREEQERREQERREQERREQERREQERREREEQERREQEEQEREEQEKKDDDNDGKSDDDDSSDEENDSDSDDGSDEENDSDSDDGSDDDDSSDENKDSDDDSNADDDSNSDSDDDDEKDDKAELCEFFETDGVLDLNDVAPAECQELASTDKRLGLFV